MQIPDGEPLADLAERERALAAHRRTLGRLPPLPRRGLPELLEDAARLLRRRDVQTGLAVIGVLSVATLILGASDRRR